MGTSSLFLDPEVAPSALAKALAGYRRCLEALTEAGTESRRLLVECEALAWVLVAQGERARASAGYDLGELRSFRTSRSRYLVGRGAAGLAVTRRGEGDDGRCLHGVSIAPQRIVRGAPVVLLAAGTGAWFTGRVVALEVNRPSSCACACGACS